MIEKCIKIMMLLVINGSINLSSFNGQITVKKVSDLSPTFQQIHDNSSHRLDPIDLYLNTTDIYSICGDTIVLESLNALEEIYYMNVQIGENIYTNSGTQDLIKASPFIDVTQYPNELSLVDDWKIEEDLMYGSNRSTQFQLKIDTAKIYEANVILGGVGAALFNEKGLIMEFTREFRDLKEVRAVRSITEDDEISCFNLLSQYNFYRPN